MSNYSWFSTFPGLEKFGFAELKFLDCSNNSGLSFYNSSLVTHVVMSVSHPSQGSFETLLQIEWILSDLLDRLQFPIDELGEEGLVVSVV